MGLGSNIDDSNFDRSAILYEAAVQAVVKERAEGEAIKVAEQLHAARTEAEKSGQAILDEQSNATSYHDTGLNPDPVSVSQREAISRTFQTLCENEGIEAL